MSKATPILDFQNALEDFDQANPVQPNVPDNETIERFLRALHQDKSHTDVDRLVADALQSAWLRNCRTLTLHSKHKILTCRCIGCRRWRCETWPGTGRPKTSRMRAFHMRDEMFMRVQRLAVMKNEPMARQLRAALRLYLRMEEKALGIYDNIHDTEEE